MSIIATMKCLGSRNETIAFLFIAESLVIGLLGGIGGATVGAAAVFLRLSIRYKDLLWSSYSPSDMGNTFFICLICSLLLAMVAAIYPAWVASRMAPMEAMRVD